MTAPKWHDYVPLIVLIPLGLVWACIALLGGLVLPNVLFDKIFPELSQVEIDQGL